MADTELLAEEYPLPETKLDSRVLELIRIFVEENKDKYKPYSGLSEDYQDCMVYSKKLYDLLHPFIPNLQFLYISPGKKMERLFGSEVEFPLPSIHAALVDTSLGIVIEPQTGRITYWDNNFPNSATEYYKKGLGIETPFFTISDEYRYKGDWTPLDS